MQARDRDFKFKFRSREAGDERSARVKTHFAKGAHRAAKIRPPLELEFRSIEIFCRNDITSLLERFLNARMERCWFYVYIRCRVLYMR